MHVCALYFFFCLHAFNKLFDSYIICFEYVWIVLLPLYSLFYVHVYYLWIALVPHGRGLDVRRP